MIHLLKDIIKEINDYSLPIPDDKWITFYPTEIHKEQNSPWYMPTKELQILAHYYLNKNNLEKS